jgi:RNA polymerase sigma-70 factor (ECF subfamily)
VSGQQLDSIEILGDYSREAWRGVYDKYSAQVWLYVSRWVGSDAHAVADVVQETFLAVTKNWDQFDPARGTIWAWISGIAHKQAALFWRKRSRNQSESREQTIDSAATPDDSAESPIAALELAETVEEVRRVMAELNSGYAALLIAKYADGSSLAELHERFGGTLEGVRSKLARARREFRERFAKQNPEIAERWLVAAEK